MILDPMRSFLSLFRFHGWRRPWLVLGKACTQDSVSTLNFVTFGKHYLPTLSYSFSLMFHSSPSSSNSILVSASWFYMVWVCGFSIIPLLCSMKCFSYIDMLLNGWQLDFNLFILTFDFEVMNCCLWLFV